MYGHPAERRLAHHPDVLATLAEEVANESLVWRVTLTEFAHWWRWRASRTWSVLARGEGRFEIQFDDWGNEFPLTLELVRENHRATIPLTRPVTPLQLDELAYERRETPAELPAAFTVSRPPSLRSVVRHAIDWETITPLDELPAHTLAARMKKGLRWWRQSRREEARR